MKRLRVASAVLIGVSLLSLTACGGEEPTTTAAGSTPTAATASSAPAAAETPAGGGTSDKEICESAKKAGEEMKTAVVAAFKAGGEPSADAFKKVLDDLDKKLAALTADAGDTEVAAALKQISAEAATAAKAADPVEAAAASSFEKAGTDLTAACKAAGVDVNF